MDHVGRLFWKRFLVVTIVSIIIGVLIGNYYNWVFGLFSYWCVQWFSLPVLFRMSMND